MRNIELTILCKRHHRPYNPHRGNRRESGGIPTVRHYIYPDPDLFTKNQRQVTFLFKPLGLWAKCYIYNTCVIGASWINLKVIDPPPPYMCQLNSRNFLSFHFRKVLNFLSLQSTRLLCRKLKANNPPPRVNKILRHFLSFHSSKVVIFIFLHTIL